MDNDRTEKQQDKVKIGFDDILAIMIAQFQILFPLALGFAVINFGLCVLPFLNPYSP